MKDYLARDNAVDKLVGTRLRAGLKPGSAGCPDAEILAAYVERTLAKRELRTCETHLASCMACQALVAELVRLSEHDEPAAIQSAPAAASRFRWAWAGSALAAVLVVGLWFTGEFRRHLQSPQETQIQTANSNQTSAPEPLHDQEKQVASPPVVPSQPPEGRKLENNGLDAVAPAAPEPSVSRKDQLQESKAVGGFSRALPPDSRATVTRSAAANGLAGIPTSKSSATSGTQLYQDRFAKGAGAPPPQMSAEHIQPVMKPAPLSASSTQVKIAAASAGVMATPADRAKLAKVGAGVGGGVGQGAGQGLGPNKAEETGSGVGATLQATDKSKDERAPGPPPPPPVLAKRALQPNAAEYGQTKAAKSKLRDEGQAKEKSDAMQRNTAVLREEAQPKQEADSEAKLKAAANAPVPITTQSVQVQAASQSVEVQAQSAAVQSESVAPRWRVGRRGMIREIDSTGFSKKRRSGVRTTLNEIKFSSASAGWVVGDSGTVLRTTDGGATWIKLPSPTAGDLVHVTVISDQAASVVTRSGATFTTTDGGKTWSGK